MLKITMVAETLFHDAPASRAVWNRTGADKDGVWIDFEGSDASDIAEFAGRACYESWTKPNPDTATPMGYHKHITDVGHFSVFEHGSVSFYVEGVSRSLTHELVRHRHFSYSQLSQRFVKLTKVELDQVVSGQEPWVVPPLFDGDFVAGEILASAWAAASEHYDQLLERAEQILDVPGMTGTMARKRAREAARAVLPNMTPTAVVITGNHRAWRDAILKRATEAADAEICAMFVEIYRQLRQMAPELYQDMHMTSAGGRDVVCNCKDNAGA